MRILGIDLGSRTIKWVYFEGENLKDFGVIESGYNPLDKVRPFFEKIRPEKTVATGYGRHLAKEALKAEVVTEIKAHATGIYYLNPEIRTIIDIGGQDSKVIKIDEKGRVLNFLMNEKCAAGTGRFLEIMALGLGITLEDLSQAPLLKNPKIKIGSMCTVFAESEVISLKHKGVSLEEIIMAIHESIAERIMVMLERLGVEEKIAFTGGVAKNKALKALLESKLKLSIFSPDYPEITGALGAALLALKGI
ncbi:MAG: acyl-CoA dehydratase activase [Caldimicrobium sp.]|jgi:predicted CoA-substrate-specific enzyme activase